MTTELGFKINDVIPWGHWEGTVMGSVTRDYKKIGSGYVGE